MSTAKEQSKAGGAEAAREKHAPRTDAAAFLARTGRHSPGELNSVVIASFAEKLERELAETKAQRDELLEACKALGFTNTFLGGDPNSASSRQAIAAIARTEKGAA